MSVYTTEVRYICECASGLLLDVGYNDIDTVIENSWKKIFENFPIFNESYREVLCKKILAHYYTREIGAETVALWKFWLNRKMREIMPYYNKLYETEMLKFDPLNEIDFTKSYTEKNANNTIENNDHSKNSTNSESSSTTANSKENFTGETKNVIASNTETTATDAGTIVDSSTNKSTKLHSDTPQGSLQNIESNSYLTDAEINSTENSNTKTLDTTNHIEEQIATDNSTDINNSNSTESDTTSKNTASASEASKITNNINSAGSKEIIEKYSGKNSSKSYAELITEYRESILNIDLMIILELSDLFLNIY